MQRLPILFAGALVALALCAAEESYSGLDDEISPPVGSTAPGGSLSYAEALRLAQPNAPAPTTVGTSLSSVSPSSVSPCLSPRPS